MTPSPVDPAEAGGEGGVAAHIRRLVDTFPSFTGAQAAKLRVLLAPALMATAPAIYDPAA
ncbi:hypothetical protein [Frankia sp. ACN1ag]|uniref:hypothetical protein n=1 Tax=Frankia sp. ACN1ag TaxID=102891 RepID=UPI0007081929|nr:hypothetical protein [Frankia sp. ACN1ag]KQC39010.1 hypothetical protein UK82_07390 [Frankia sp. ACN1ag]